MRKYKRWVMIGGKYDLTKLLEIARREGMKIICAESASFCCWYNLGVYGSREQIDEVEQAWKDAGVEVKNRRPKGAFQFNLDIPRDEWID